MELACVPERILPHIIASVEEDNDASMTTNVDTIVSRTEFDSHTNTVVVGKHAYILTTTGER